MLFENNDTEFNPRTANSASVVYTVNLTMTLHLHVSGRHIPRRWGLAHGALYKTPIHKLVDEFTITSHPCHSFLSIFVSTSTIPAITSASLSRGSTNLHPLWLLPHMGRLVTTVMVRWTMRRRACTRVRPSWRNLHLLHTLVENGLCSYIVSEHNDHRFHHFRPTTRASPQTRAYQTCHCHGQQEVQQQEGDRSTQQRSRLQSHHPSPHPQPSGKYQDGSWQICGSTPTASSSHSSSYSTSLVLS